MSGEALNIPFYGIDRQPLDRQRTPGVCEVLRNLRPKGSEKQPRWAATGKPKHLVADSSETPGVAEGRIIAVRPAEDDPGKAATGSLSVTSAITGAKAVATLYLTSNAGSDGGLEITFTNAGAADRTETVQFSEGESAQIIAARIAAATSDSTIAAQSGQYELNGILVYGVQWQATEAGTAGNTYNVDVQRSDSRIGVAFQTDNFAGGKDASQSISIRIGEQQSNPVEISDANNNNTPNAIAAALREAVNSGIIGWTASSLASNGVNVTSSSNQASDNNKPVSLEPAGTSAGEALRVSYTTTGPTSGGTDSRGNWGKLRIDIPDAPTPVSVETDIIGLNEPNDAIANKIKTALESDADFTAQYVFDRFPLPSSLVYKAIEPGPEYNSRIQLEGASKGFAHATWPFSGGQNIVDGAQARAAAWQNRSRYGEKTIDKNAGLQRIVTLSGNKILIVDPTQDYFATIVRTLPPEPDGYNRTATFSQVGETMLICLALEPENGTTAIPEDTLLLIDDVFVPLRLPPLPRFKIARKYRWFATSQDDQYGFDEGFYAVRLAWRFKDGSHSSLSAPVRTPFLGYDFRNDTHDEIQFPEPDSKPEFDSGPEGLDWRWAFVMHIGLEQSIEDVLSGTFRELRDYIDGVAVFVSSPFYEETLTRLSQEYGALNERYREFFRRNPAFAFPYSDERPQEQVLFDNLFYDVGTIPRQPSKNKQQELRGIARPPADIAALPHQFLVDDSSVKLLTRDTADESVLIGVHHIRAAVGFSYNKRYLMGNTSVVFGDPAEVMKWSTEGETIPVKVVRIVIAIDINGSVHRVLSKPVIIDKERFVIEPVYPDRYASHIEVWASYEEGFKRLLANRSGSPTGRVSTDDDQQTTSDEEAPKTRIKLQSSRRNNFAYDPYLLTYNVPATPPTYPDGSEDLPFYEENTSDEHQAGRLFASDPLNPFKIEAARTYYTENREPITAFGVNAMPVSSGQFGQYPLYIFTPNSISALEQVSDARIAFGRMSPISISIGCDSPRAITNAGRSIMFASAHGIFMLPGELDQPISRPVDPVITADMSGASLGFYQQGEVQELWVSAPSATGETYCYSLKHRRWFSVSGSRRQFLTDLNGALYSIGLAHPYTEAGLWREEDSIAEATNFEIRTGALNFGIPDLPKRIWNLIIRWKTGSEKPTIQLIGLISSAGTDQVAYALLPAGYHGPQVRPRSGSALEYKLTITGSLRPEDWIESFDVRMEARYPHRSI